MKFPKKSKLEKIIDPSSSHFSDLYLDVKTARLFGANAKCIVGFPVLIQDQDVSGSVPVDAFLIAKKLSTDHLNAEIVCAEDHVNAYGSTFPRRVERSSMIVSVFDQNFQSESKTFDFLAVDPLQLKKIQDAVNAKFLNCSATKNRSIIVAGHGPNAIPGNFSILSEINL